MSVTAARARLDELKALCVEGESEEAHAAHAEDLANAYREFAGRQIPALTPPGVTEMTADVVVSADVPAGG